MAVRTITTRLALDGEAEYRAQVKKINEEYSLFRAELAKVDAQFKGQLNSVSALTAKEAALASQEDALKKKFEAQSEMLRWAEQAYQKYSYEVEQSSGKLERAKARLEELKKSTNDTSAAEEKITAEIKKHKEALEASQRGFQQAENSINNYRKALNYTQRDQAELSGSLSDTRRYLEEAKASADGTAKSIDGFGKAAAQTGGSVDALAAALQAAGVAAALKEIADAITASVDSSLEFETAMANVNKVAKLSDEELSGMAEQIKQLSTEMPATTSEIAQVVEAAARLGIAKEYLIEFSSVMLDLGNVSDLTSDQAATALARFANITGTAAEDYERLGSTIVALGNNFATSESEITNMSSRLASAGKLAGLSESQIMGLAAAMSSVSIEAEAGGTAMTQTLTAIEKAVSSGGAKLEEFARIAGMSSQQFSDAWANDPITAIQAFITGLGGLDEQGESATQVLDELGLSGIRQSNMLKSLALANETLVDAVSLANRAWNENTELAETAAAKYDTTQAKMQMAANAANNLMIAVGDQLTPALGILADAGTGAFSFAEEFVEECPALVSGITGVVAATGVMAAGFTVYAAKAGLATIATTAWGSALLATPIGPVAAAVGVLVTAVTLYANAADEADSRAKSLADSMKANADAIEAQRTAAAEQRETVEYLAAQMEELAGKENKTTAEKERLLAITEQLNEAVPGLKLTYDSLSDTLSMTTEQVLALARAQADAQERSDLAAAIVQAERDQAQAVKELEQAQIDLTDAIERRNRAIAEGTYMGLGAENALELDNQVRQAEQAVKDLENALAESEAQVAEMETALDGLSGSVQEAGAGMESVSEELEETAQAAEETAAVLAGLEETTLYLVGANDALTDALKEQSEQGNLSLQTALDLIEAGYGAALAVDEETGAVTLNREEYIRLAGAKIQEQIATLEAEKAELQHTAALDLETAAANRSSRANWEAATAKAAKTAADKDDILSLDTQIAALKQAQNSLGSYTGAVETAARRSSSASRKIKTQAQQDLEAYKQLKAELDHQKNVDLVDEAEYYRKMAQYRDQYLTDDANVSEYRKVTEQIYKYDKSLAEQEAKLWEEQSGKLVSELEQRVKSLMDQQSKMAEKLASHGDLYQIDGENLIIEDPQKGLDAIEAYGNALERLKERGVSGGLMDKVLGMDVDTATKYANELLQKSDEKWEEYNNLFDEKQKRATEIAEQFFKDEMTALDTEYSGKLGDVLSELTRDSFKGGEDTAQGLIDGLASKEAALYAQAKRMADEVSSILSGAMSSMSLSMDTSRISEPAGVTKQDLNRAVSLGVNGVQAGMASRPVQVDLTAEFNVNGRKLAETTIQDYRYVDKANPEVRNDS